MRSARTRNVLLSLTGLVALSVYIIACRPAFSPDGTKVLVPVVDPDAMRFSVAVHDLESGKTKWLCEAISYSGDEFGVAATWLADSKRAVVVWSGTEGKKNRMQARILPDEAGRAARVFEFDGGDDAVFGLIFPPVVIGNRLYLGGNRIQRLDLGSGDVKTAPASRGAYLSSRGGQLYYITERGKEEDEQAIEIGTVDPDSLAQQPILLLRKKDVGDVGAFMAVSRDRSRIAVVSQTKGKEARAILIYKGKELENKIPLPSEFMKRKVGTMEWSPDGKAFYLAYARSQGQAGVLEIPASGNAVREIPLFESALDDDELVLSFQIALSPDGKTLAAGTTCVREKKLAKKDRALWLVDLTGKERKPRKVAPPPFPKK